MPMPKDNSGSAKKVTKRGHQLKKVQFFKTQNSVKERVEQVKFKLSKRKAKTSLSTKTRALSKAECLESLILQ